MGENFGDLPTIHHIFSHQCFLLNTIRQFTCVYYASSTVRLLDRHNLLLWQLLLHMIHPGTGRLAIYMSFFMSKLPMYYVCSAPYAYIGPYTYGTSHMRILIWDAHTCMGQHFDPYEYFICMFYFFTALYILLV